MYAIHIISEYVNQHKEQRDSKEWFFTAVPYGHAAMPAVYPVSGKL